MALSDTAALVASLELQDKFSGPARKAESSLDRLTSKTSTLGKVAGHTQAGLGNLAHSLGNIATIGIGAAVAGLALSIRSASNLEESLSKVRVVFGDTATAIEAWAATASTAFGQTKQQALEAAGTFGNLFQAFGIARPEAAEMSTSLVELAADLASFNNTSVDDALIALRSGLSGETEPLKRYGVAINDARLKTAALRLGLIKSTKDALTPAAKAAAAYALIMEDTALAQGDFARTSGGLANQQRILQAKLGDIAATIGTALLPKITELAVKFSDLLTKNQPLIEEFANKLPGLFDKLVGVAENLPWDAIGQAFQLMATGAQTFLDAFTNLPPDAQAFILALGGLNKLTGGAVTSIFTTLASGLIKGVLGMTAGVVNITAGVVNGGVGGIPATAGKVTGGLIISSLLGVASAVALGGLIGAGIGGAIAEEVIVPARSFEEERFGERGRTPEATQKNLDLLRDQLYTLQHNGQGNLNALGALLTGTESIYTTLERQIAILEDEQTQQRLHEHSQRENNEQIAADNAQGTQFLGNIEKVQKDARTKLEENNRELTQTKVGLTAQLQTNAASTERKLQDIRASVDAKKLQTTVNVGVTSNVAITDITRRLVSQRISIGGTGGITIE